MPGTRGLLALPLIPGPHLSQQVGAVAGQTVEVLLSTHPNAIALRPVRLLALRHGAEVCPRALLRRLSLKPLPRRLAQPLLEQPRREPMAERVIRLAATGQQCSHRPETFFQPTA